MDSDITVLTQTFKFVQTEIQISNGLYNDLSDAVSKVGSVSIVIWDLSPVDVNCTFLNVMRYSLKTAQCHIWGHFRLVCQSPRFSCNIRRPEIKRKKYLTTIGGPWYFWKGSCTSKAHKPVTISGNPTFLKV